MIGSGQGEREYWGVVMGWHFERKRGYGLADCEINLCNHLGVYELNFEMNMKIFIEIYDPNQERRADLQLLCHTFVSFPGVGRAGHSNAGKRRGSAVNIIGHFRSMVTRNEVQSEQHIYNWEKRSISILINGRN